MFQQNSPSRGWMCWPLQPQSALRSSPSSEGPARNAYPTSRQSRLPSSPPEPLCPRTLSGGSPACSLVLGLSSVLSWSCWSRCHVCWWGGTTRTQSQWRGQCNLACRRIDRWPPVAVLGRDLRWAKKKKERKKRPREWGLVIASGY